MAIRLLLLPFSLSHPERTFRPDSLDYLRLGANLEAGHGFSRSEGPPYLPDVARTPVYPVFLAGIRLIAGGATWPVVVAQVLLGGIGCGLTYLLGRRLLPETGARIAAILQALSLGAIVYTTFILTETLFTLLLLGTVCVGAGFVAPPASMTVAPDPHLPKGRYRSLLRGAGAGVLGGLTILCRPIALFFPVLVGILVMARRSADPPHQRRFRAASGLILIAASAAVILPWIARNARIAGIPTISSTGSYNLLFYEAAPVKAEVDGVSEERAREELSQEVEEGLVGGTTAGPSPRILSRPFDLRLKLYNPAGVKSRLELYNRIAWGILAAHPFRAAGVHLRGCLASLLPNASELLELLGASEGGRGTLGRIHQEGLRSAAAGYLGGRWWLLLPLSPFLLLLALVYAGALAGTWWLARRREWGTLLLLVLPIVYFLLLPGPASHPRFRVPVMPYVNLLAASGLLGLSQRRSGTG